MTGTERLSSATAPGARPSLEFRRSVLLSRLRPLTADTSQEAILDALRTVILSGEVPPGTAIPVADVAGHFRVSHIPVREALKALFAEQLVDHRRNAGYTVAKLTWSRCWPRSSPGTPPPLPTWPPDTSTICRSRSRRCPRIRRCSRPGRADRRKRNRASVAGVWTEADRESTFARVSRHVSSLPAAQALPWGQHLRLSVRGKGFGWLLNDHHGNGRLALSVKAPLGAQQAYVGSDPLRYFLPEYDGKNGWVGVHLDPEHHPDWAEIGVLVEQGWRMTASRTLVREFESAHE